MGGSSSNDQKTNQINKDMANQLLKNLDTNAKTKGNNDKNNSPTNSNRNSPLLNKNMQQYVQNDNLRINDSKISKKSRNSQLRVKKNNSAKQNYIQSKFSKGSSVNKIRNQKIGNQWLPSTNEEQINLQMYQLFPNNYQRKFEQFTHLQKKSTQHQAIFKWQNDRNTKNWLFSLIQNNQLSISFQVDSQNSLISGEKYKWLALSPIKQNGKFNKYRQNFICQTIYQVFDQVNHENIEASPIKKQYKDFEEDIAGLCKKWDQPYLQSYAQFTHNKKDGSDRLKITDKKKHIKSQCYLSLNKFYFIDSHKWLVSSFILQEKGTFKAWLIWNQAEQIDFEDESKMDEIQQLIYKQQNIIKLKMDIYIYKMKNKLIQNQ